MSDAAVTPVEPSPPPSGTAPARSRTWLADVRHQTFGRTTARFGLVWIIVVAVGAVFAPFIANSYPIAVKMDGRWSSPLLRHLTPADVTLLSAAVLTAVLLPRRRWSLGWRLLILVGSIAVVAVLSLLLVRPPAAPVYEEFRELANAGRVEKAIFTPIPYSANDRQRDDFDIDNPHPRRPSRQNLLGTNMHGADVASHMIYACRIAMAIGFISTGLAALIGVIIGGLMGYFIGLVDLLGMRLIEIFSSIPTLYLLLTFVAAFPDYRSIYLIMAIIGLTGWTGDARFVRAEFLKLRNQDFVQAAVAAGLPLRSVLFRHLLPNAVAPLLVSSSFGIAGAILTESTLSFLGLGIPVGEASWGQLLSEAVSAGGGFVWWLATFPGFAIFLTVLSYNLIGEAVRDALDPKLRKRE